VGTEWNVCTSVANLDSDCATV